MEASKILNAPNSDGIQARKAERLTAVIVGLLVQTLGITVIVGWFAHARVLTNLHPSLPPMQFNTALAFICCGTGYLFVCRGKVIVTRIAGSIGMMIGLLTLFEYVSGFDIGIDGLLFDQTPDPNRMAPNTAICFTLSGASLLLVRAKHDKAIYYVFRALLCSAVLCLSLASIIGYLANIQTAYGWGNLTRMAMHTASGFVILGAGGLELAYQASRQNQQGYTMRWVPWIAAFSIGVLALTMWQALQAEHHGLALSEGAVSIYSVLSWTLLIGGLLLAGLMQLTLSRSAEAQVRAAEHLITERQLQEVIRELQTQKYALDQHSIVAITDAHGVITVVNDKFCEISGYSREELIGQTHRIINSGTHPKAFFVDLWKAITSGQSWQGEICNRAKDGTLYWVATTIVPFTDASGKIKQYASIRTDVTAHKTAEAKILSINNELVQKNAEMEQFAYTVSHDLKSPTVTIRGYTGYLQQDVAQQRYDRVERFTEAIIRATEKMRITIDDLLELSRIGRVTHDMAPIRLVELIQLVVSELKPQIDEIGAAISVSDEMPDIYGDHVRIEQVVQNLLSNALKYAYDEAQTLRINITAESDGKMVRLEVRDNGPGVPGEFAEKVFGLFERLQGGTDGTGIGLAIVRRIAELHGGRAWVTAAPGGGAAFNITLPGIQSSEASSQPVPVGVHAE